jgi:enoyl-CoA hydratase
VTVALACDVIVTTPEGRFDPRFLDLAIHPGGAHLWRLSRRVGYQGAAALVLCGDALDGREAASVGLAWRCLPDRDAADAMAQRFATRTARRSPELVRRTKASLVASTALDTAEEAFALELAAQEWSVSRPEHAAAVQAAVSRTIPVASEASPVRG